MSTVRNEHPGSFLSRSGRLRVLVVAYAYSPSMGSEYRHAWELSRELARHHDVTLLFGDSDGLMGSFNSYDKYVSVNVDPVRAVKVQATKAQMAIARLMLRFPFTLLFAVLLRQWHKKAFRVAEALHAEEPFDVIHQLGPIGFRNPGYCWKLNATSYWGPIGGAQYINLRMIRRKFSIYFLEAVLRNVDVWCRRFSPYLRSAAYGFDRLSFATPENQRYFETHFSRTGEIISDQGLYADCRVQYSDHAPTERLIVAWGGTLNARKNVELLVAIADKCPSNVEFCVMGDGPLRHVVDRAAKRNSRISVFGQLSRNEVQTVLRDAHAILLTSLSEANTAILFEGMENGCIPIAPKINGFAACLDDSFSLTYPNDEWDQTVSSAVCHITQLSDPDFLAQKRESLVTAVESLTWRSLALKHMRNYA